MDKANLINWCKLGIHDWQYVTYGGVQPPTYRCCPDCKQQQVYRSSRLGWYWTDELTLEGLARYASVYEQTMMRIEIDQAANIPEWAWRRIEKLTGRLRGMADEKTYMVMFEIQIPEKATGMMDREFSGLETEKVSINANEHTEGWLKALNDGEHGSKNIDTLHTLIYNGYDLELVPMDHNLVKVEQIKKD